MFYERLYTYANDSISEILSFFSNKAFQSQETNGSYSLQRHSFVQHGPGFLKKKFRFMFVKFWEEKKCLEHSLDLYKEKFPLMCHQRELDMPSLKFSSKEEKKSNRTSTWVQQKRTDCSWRTSVIDIDFYAFISLYYAFQGHLLPRIGLIIREVIHAVKLIVKEFAPHSIIFP